MRPSVGRIVQFNTGTKDSPVWLAAIVCFVHHPGLVSLSVFPMHGGPAVPKPQVAFGDDQGQWRWPPRA